MLNVHAQDRNVSNFWTPSDTLHPKRFYTSAAVVGIGTLALDYALYSTWYEQYPREGFHFFDDSKEWLQMDKAGHVFSSYHESRIIYQLGKWSGVSEKSSMWMGMGYAAFFQTTIELFDGFSSKWGFSVSDFATNIGGIAAFGLQQEYWKEQKILFKFSSSPIRYSPLTISSLDGTATSTLERRTNALFGTGFAESLLKDYNAQTLWISANVHSFFPKTKFPEWLNIALGYGGQNMFGGFENRWTEGENEFLITDPDFQAYRQYYLSLDVDFTRIKTKSSFVKMLLHLLNMIKVPSPSLELNSKGKAKFHWLFF